jgi:hypothetical protein
MALARVIEERPVPQYREKIDIADEIGDRVHGGVVYNSLNNAWRFAYF